MSTRKLSTDNSALIHQVNAGLYSKAEIEALLGIGIANKNWFNVMNEGGFTNDFYENVSTWRNSGADNMHIVFGGPIPLTLANGAYNIVLTRIKLGTFDSDANDFVDRVRIFAMPDHDTVDTIVDLNWDVLYGTAIQEATNDFADQTIGGAYERFAVRIDATNTVGKELDVTYIQLEYYYAAA